MTPKTNGLPLERLPESLQLTEIQFRAFLRALSNKAGSMAELSRQLEVSGQFLGDVCAGRKRAGPKLLGKLGASVTKVYTVSLIQEDAE